MKESSFDLYRSAKNLSTAAKFERHPGLKQKINESAEQHRQQARKLHAQELNNRPRSGNTHLV